MCTPWTMTRLVRWRVRDWASCFLACSLPLDDEPQVAVRNMAFDKKNDRRVNRIYNNKLSRPSKKCNKKRQINNQMEKNNDGVSVGNRIDDSSWSLSADEDYIVFCFREDGAFDVLKDGKSVKSEPLSGLHSNPRNSRPVNRKLNYGEDAEQVSNQNMHKERSNDTDRQDQYRITPCKEDEEKDIRYMGRQQHRDSIRKPCQIEEIEDRGMVSTESRDSDLSEGSTGSFAFPVLGWEWIGSPAQLPKSEGLHLSKQKVRSVRFQCCRF